MSAWAQFSGQLVRTVRLKQRRFGRLVGEVVLPVLLFCALAALKGLSEIDNVEAQSYANEAYQVPELDDFLTFEPLENPYVLLNFGNLAKLESTIGWNCDLNPDNAGSGFFSVCENIQFAIVPEDGDDAEASAASRELKDYIINSSNSPEAMAAKFVPEDLFSDATELATYVESPQYGTSSSKPRLGLAIVMNSPTSYTIRTNTTIRMFDGPPPDENELDDLQRGRTTPNEDFRAFGLLSAQMAVDRFIIARETGRAVTLKASHFPMPTSAFKQDEFWTVDDTVQLFGMLAVLYPTAAVIMFLVEDKSSKVRELMFTMGLRPAAYQLAWLLVYGIIFSVLAIVVAVISSEAIFVETETSVLIVFMWLFFMDVLAFAFLISSIFSRTTIAVVVGLMVTFLCNTIYSSLNNESATSELRSVYSLLHPILGFSFGVVAFAKYEVGLVGVSWDNYNLSENDELTVQQAMRNLVIAVVWHLLAAAYIDSLSRHKWHWPVTQWFRNTSSGQSQYAADVDAVEEVSKDPTNRFEPVPAALKELRSQGRCVLIHNATKDFKTSKGVVHALRGLSVDMFEGQITVLLGPNGAGKSTTSSIITGVINPTSGHAYVNGQKCETNLADVRKSLGICPQHNILDTLLTVNENLQVVASIKGMPKGKVMGRINELLGELGLLPKASTAVKNLSGGMKRKLQLAMALFDSKVVILDEPTSGMDTFARQAAQRTIMKHREGRTIILTTHYMDEADMLGDRIAIVADGRLACCGTSLYLKKQYGVGYLLSFEQRSEAHSARETIMESVRSFVPEMEVLSNVGSELVLRLPLSASPSFAGMLRTIEARKAELGIDELGISVTTLDSVFQSATKGLEPLVPESRKEDDGPLLMDIQKESTADSTANAPLPKAVATEAVSGISLVKTLVQKRVLTSSRDRRAWCCQILIPVVFLILGFASSMNFSNQVQPAVLDLTDSLGVWNEALGVSPVPYGAPAANEVMEYLSFPNLDSSHEVAITSTGSFCIESDELFRRIQVSAVLLVAFEPELEDQQDALLAQVLSTAPICDASSGFNGSTLALSDYLQDTRLSFEASRYAGLLVQSVEQGDSELSGEYTIAYNFTARRSSSGLLSRTNAALLRLWTGNAELDIKASLQPLPLTFEESKFVSAIAGFPVVLMFGTAFSFFAAQFAVFMVHEKETKAWHQQLINGVSPRSYWVSNYLFDLCSLFIPLVVSLALLYAFDVTVFIEEIGAVVLVFVLFALAVTPFTYCLTFLFSTGAAAQTGVLGIHVLGSMVLFIASFTMGLLENTVEINDALVYIYRILPTFAFVNALSRLSITQILNIILNLGEDGREVSNPRAYDVWDLDIAGKDMIYLGVEAILYPILLVLLQGRFRSGLCSMSGIFKRRGRNQIQDKLETTRFLDDDVAAEATLIKNVIHSPPKGTDAEVGHEEMAALLAGVRKVYPNGKVAVKDMSLGFRKNECFGLLGVNGAGKSTTQAMLSAEFPPTSGEIRIGTADVVRDPAGAQRHLGYCPQFDALFELLTGREHLSFYAKVKGIPAAQRAQVVQNKLEQFDLTKFGDKPAGGYSGGNKRKLSVAIATIGDPDFVLLDEPSAGVDPEARKFLAKAIQKLATKTSICLTTHSMEECEALCARIGIMVDGGLQCLGSAQHLKSKFGRGMQFEAMVRIPEDREVEELAAKMRGNSTFDSVDKAAAMQALNQIGASATVSHNFDTSYIAAGLAASSGTVKLTTLADWFITECNFLAVLGMLAEHFDGVAQVTERQGQRVRISIPQQTRLSLGDMFDIIENNRSVVGIADFALSQTTLESIFNGMAATQSDARD